MRIQKEVSMRVKPISALENTYIIINRLLIEIRRCKDAVHEISKEKRNDIEKWRKRHLIIE